VALLPVAGKLYARAVLLDTGAFLAIADLQDADHQEAMACLSRIADLRLPAVVTVPTVHESHRRLLYSLGEARARRFLDSVFDGTLNVIGSEPVDEQEAVKLIDRYRSLELTLTDAANMAVMTRLQIGAAFSFDRHFLQAGYIRVPPMHL
jgi:predicted nucleic acid-binding protein